MTTLTSPHDLLAAIPFLIGYHPIDSLVLVSIKEDCVGMAMRIDYPIDQNEVAFDLCASHISADEAEGALSSLLINHTAEAMAMKCLPRPLPRSRELGLQSMNQFSSQTVPIDQYSVMTLRVVR